METYTHILKSEPVCLCLCLHLYLCAYMRAYNTKAVEACALVLKEDPTAIKAYFRRAQANEALNKHQLALVDLRYVFQRQGGVR